jgi:hypothetical protein
VAPTPEDRVARLYRVDPKQFVRERNSLAKELNGAGDAAGAKRVRSLRKPRKAAWALNVVAHDDADTVNELREAGAQLKRAQESAVGGNDDESLRQASNRRRALIGRLTDAAVTHAGESHRDTIEATLSAASVDAGIGDRLTGGRLVKDHSAPTGVGELGSLVAGAKRRKRRDKGEIRHLKRELSKVETSLERRTGELARARDRLAQAEKSVESAAGHVEDLRHRKLELESQLQEATK